MSRPGKVVVVGAGVTGLASALLLARRGWQVEVHEAAATIGGMLAPVRFRGVDCDLGAHRLHEEALTIPLIGELAGAMDLRLRPRSGQIVLGGRHTPYPIDPVGLFRGLGLRQGAAFAASWLCRPAALAGWESDRTGMRDGDMGYEAFVVGRVGRSAYEAFYRPYAEKVWGVEPGRLSQTVAKKRLSSSRPLGLLIAAGRRRGSRSRFLYPHAGMGRVADVIAASAREAGAYISFGRPWNGDPATIDADAIVLASPLAGAAGLADLSLPLHRGLHLLLIALPAGSLATAGRRADAAPVDTWYVPEARYEFGRVSEVAQFSGRPAPGGEVVLCVEVPDARRGPDRDPRLDLDALIDQLVAAGIVRPGVRPLEVLWRHLRGVYPLYERGWVPSWQHALRRLGAGGRVYPVGRQGLLLHCNVDHCVAMASDLVDHLDSGGSAAAWAASASRYLGVQVRD